MWWLLHMVNNFWDVAWLLICCSRGTVSYIPCSHILRGILVLALSSVSSGCVCGWVWVCDLGHIWLAFDLGEALRCMPRCERLGCSLLSLYPVTLWQRLLPATPPSLVLLPFEGREVSFLFSYWFLYNWSCLVVDKASLTPPGSQFRAPSRLLLKITDYLSLLPTFPGSDIRTPGVSRPGFAWKAYG